MGSDRLCGSKVPGSVSQLRETGFRTQGIVKVPVQKVACPRFRKFRCSMGSDGLGSGLDGTGSGNRVPGTRGIKKVSGSGDSVPKVPKVTWYFESILLYFERKLL